MAPPHQVFVCGWQQPTKDLFRTWNALQGLLKIQNASPRDLNTVRQTFKIYILILHTMLGPHRLYAPCFLTGSIFS